MQKVIIGALAPAIARRANVSWLGYGVAAYVALRLAKRYGIGGEFPGRALDFIDETVRTATGFGSRPEYSSAAAGR